MMDEEAWKLFATRFLGCVIVALCAAAVIMWATSAS